MKSKPVIRSRSFRVFEPPTNSSTSRWEIEHMPVFGLVDFEVSMQGWLDNLRSGKMQPDQAKHCARVVYQVTRELEGRGVVTV